MFSVPVKCSFTVAAMCVAASAFAALPAADRRVPFADPHVLVEDGLCYLYGTHAKDGVAVAVSTDGVHWQLDAGRAKGGLALHRDDSYGQSKFWAPECHRIGKRYYLLYSAERHVCIAEGESPLGPFRQAEKRPLIADEAIDSTLYSEDGRAYMLYATLGDEERIHIVAFTPDLRGLRMETDRTLLVASEPWERIKGKLVEGPSLVKHGGLYYLMYSANCCTSPDYAVGYACSKDLFGPYEKSAANPILRRAGGLVGTGHGAPYRALDGSWRYVFHSHASKDCFAPRVTHSVGLAFSDGAGLSTVGRVVTYEKVEKRGGGGEG